MWGMIVGQGCLVYAYYFLLTWLPNYLQTQRGIAIFGSGMYTAIIYGTAVVRQHRARPRHRPRVHPESLRAGGRRIAVVLSFIPALLIVTTPWLTSTWAVVLALTISVTFMANAISLNSVLCNDLVQRPGDAGRAIALFTSGANVIAVTAPIVTGYLVSWWDSPAPSCWPASCWCSAPASCSASPAAASAPLRRSADRAKRRGL